MIKIIGIVGSAGNGKDTIGNYLQEKYNYRKESFAASLKDAVSSIFGWERKLLEGDTLESRKWREQPDEWWEKELKWSENKYCRGNRLTPRYMLQIFGTDVLRDNFDIDIWRKSLKNKIRNSNSDVVITDCRFLNELESIAEINGTVIRVIRGDKPFWEETAIAANRKDPKALMEMKKLNIHSSEWSWLGYEYDCVIENNSTIKDLHSKVDKYL